MKMRKIALISLIFLYIFSLPGRVQDIRKCYSGTSQDAKDSYDSSHDNSRYGFFAGFWFFF